MESLNITIPYPFECYARAKYLRNLQDLHGYAVKVYVGGLVSIPGRPLQFNVWLDNGAMFDRLPITALVSYVTDSSEQNLFQGSSMPLNEASYGERFPQHHQPWNCFDYRAVVTERAGMGGRMIAYHTGDKQWQRGEYLWTVDWPVDTYGDLGHKCAHVLWGADGNMYALPNNMTCLLDPATVSEPFAFSGKTPQILARTYNLSCEAHGGGTSTGDAFHYEVKSGEPEPACRDCSHPLSRHAHDGECQQCGCGHGAHTNELQRKPPEPESQPERGGSGQVQQCGNCENFVPLVPPGSRFNGECKKDRGHPCNSPHKPQWCPGWQAKE